jgi:hypothetical protein
MQITRNGHETGRGPADWFTGDVYIDTIASPPDASRVGAALVHFTPAPARRGTRTRAARRSGISEGVGLCQREGGPVEVIRPGDRVFFEPGENHWHGAAPTRFMAHVAIQQADDEGNVATWGEHVSDEQYGQAPSLTEGEN